MSVYDEVNKLWGSLEMSPNDAIKWTGQHALNSLSLNGSKLAQINDETGVQLTYHEMWLKTVRAAQNLLKRGFKPRDVFGFMVEHSDYLVPIVLASLCLATPMVPLHPMLSKDEIIRFFLKAKPLVAFCDISACDQLTEALKELPFSVKVFTFGGSVDGFEPVENLFVETGEENSFVPIEIDPDTDVGCIICSSGTTGPSKCMYVSYSRSVGQMATAYDSTSVFYCADSIFWTIGIKPITDCIQSGGTRIITTKPFTPETPLQLIDKYRVTIFPVATYDFIACLKTDLIERVDLSSVKKIFIFGSKMPINLLPQVKQYFPNATLCSYYGTTEIGMISVASYDSNRNDFSNGLVAGCIAKICDKNGNRCGPNMSGELCVKKIFPFLGYIDDPEANASAVDNEGFYRTGDIAYFDDSGRLGRFYFYLQERIKNTLTVFYFDSILLPFELEDCLINMPGVKEVCVVGVPIASGAVLPAALIVPKSNSTLTKHEVFDKIRKNFPERSWLRAGVYFVQSLPVNSNGKLLRREITKTAIELFEAAKLSDPDIRSYVSDIPEAFRKLIWV